MDAATAHEGERGQREQEEGKVAKKRKEKTAFPETKRINMKQSIGNRREKTKNRQNRKRTGNPLINANQT